MRKPTLVKVRYYIDVSYGNKLKSCVIHYLTPSGKPKEEIKYGDCFTHEEALAWLEGKYRLRLSNLFGLMFYIY